MIIRIATEDWEFEQIHRLNYETFVEEIPQHSRNDNGLLIDKFHRENTYIVCVKDRVVLGMVAIRANRPFSLDRKLENLDSYLPQGRTVCEIRLLAVRKEARSSRIFAALLTAAAEYCGSNGYDLAIISGTLRQIGLYRHIGFVPFAHVVGTPAAPYQPMYLTMETFERNAGGSENP